MHCNAVHLLQRLIERNIIPDTLTDQTSAHDPLIGYVPHTLTNEQANVLREQNPEQYIELAYRQHEAACRTDACNCKRWAPSHLIMEIILRARCKGTQDLKNAFDFPGFVPAYIRPLVLRRQRARFAGQRLVVILNDIACNR